MTYVEIIWIESVCEAEYIPAISTNLKDFLVTVYHEIDHALDAKKYGKKKYKDKYEMEMGYAVQKGGDAHDDNYFEKKAERFGRKMARKFLKKR